MNLYAYVGNDPVNRIDLWGLYTVTIGISGEATYGVGVAGSLGLAVTLPFGGSNFDVGIFGSVSGRFGYLVGAGPEVGISSGNIHDMRGIDYELTAGTAYGSVTGSVPAEDVQDSNTDVSAEFPVRTGSSVRVRTTSVGVSGGARATYAISLRDILSSIIVYRVPKRGSGSVGASTLTLPNGSTYTIPGDDDEVEENPK